MVRRSASASGDCARKEAMRRFSLTCTWTSNAPSSGGSRWSSTVLAGKGRGHGRAPVTSSSGWLGNGTGGSDSADGMCDVTPVREEENAWSAVRCNILDMDSGACSALSGARRAEGAWSRSGNRAFASASTIGRNPELSTPTWAAASVWGSASRDTRASARGGAAACIIPGAAGAAAQGNG